MTKRPFKLVTTQKLKFMLGVGKAGLEIWNKKNKDYANVKAQLALIEEELLLRQEEKAVA